MGGLQYSPPRGRHSLLILIILALCLLKALLLSKLPGACIGEMWLYTQDLPLGFLFSSILNSVSFQCSVCLMPSNRFFSSQFIFSGSHEQVICYYQTTAFWSKFYFRFPTTNEHIVCLTSHTQLSFLRSNYMYVFLKNRYKLISSYISVFIDFLSNIVNQNMAVADSCFTFFF